MAESAAIYCSLTSEEQRIRRSDVRALLTSQVRSSTSISDGLRIEFAESEGLRALVESFIILENSCCGFLTFTLSKPEEKLYLLIQGPPEATDVIADFHKTIQGIDNE